MERTLCLVMVVAALVVGRVAAQATPPRCRPGAAAADCRLLRADNSDNGYEFYVQRKYFSINYVDGKTIELRCNRDGPDLQSPALPRFETELRVKRMTVKQCPSSMYVDVLRALNVVPAAIFNLTLESPVGLAGSHLAGLPALRELRVSKAAAPGPLLAHLAERAALTTLSLTNTQLEPAELDDPPPSLVYLNLWDTNVTRLPARLLALRTLRSLTVFSNVVVSIDNEAGAASTLDYLYVAEAEGALLAEWLPPELRIGYLAGWRAVSPPPVPACAALATLKLLEPHTRTLPAGWVARCGNLTTLEIREATNLTELPARLLANASSLTTLVLKSGALTSLPPGLFDATPHLAHLDLSSNHLKQLPSGLLSPASSALRELNLADNGFAAGVAAALRDLTELRRLSLALNPIEDLCNKANYKTVDQNKSPLESLLKLEVLNLRKTNVTVICKDWRTDLLNLTELDLRETNIDTLGFQDLQFAWRAKGFVNLQNIPLRRLFFSYKDYEATRAVGGNVTVKFSGPGSNLTCDCLVYWWALGVEEGLVQASGAGDLRCAGGGALHDVRARERVCPAPDACPAGLPPACECFAAGGLRDTANLVLRVRCERAGLTRVPRVRDYTDIGAVDLLLAGNNIRNVTREDVPKPGTGLKLDLRNNSIERIDKSTAHALAPLDAGEGWRVFLAGNPIDCGCEGASARRVLRNRADLLEGYEAGRVRCAGGTPLVVAEDAACAASSAALPAALAAVALLVVLAAAVLAARCGVLRRLKQVLGWARRPRAFEDAPRLYDAFVTFAAGDEKGALETTARLEAGGRRVLLQERDWLPPAWTPACLATSARAAHATVALVSPAWERALLSAEVRAAFEGALLVLVLPARGDPQDTALRRYARDFPHLVVRHGCWRGLERALPPPQHPPALAPV